MSSLISWELLVSISIFSDFFYFVEQVKRKKINRCIHTLMYSTLVTTKCPCSNVCCCCLQQRGEKKEEPIVRKCLWKEYPILFFLVIVCCRRHVNQWNPAIRLVFKRPSSSSRPITEKRHLGETFPFNLGGTSCRWPSKKWPCVHPLSLLFMRHDRHFHRRGKKTFQVNLKKKWLMWNAFCSVVVAVVAPFS